MPFAVRKKGQAWIATGTPCTRETFNTFNKWKTGIDIL